MFGALSLGVGSDRPSGDDVSPSSDGNQTLKEQLAELSPERQRAAMDFMNARWEQEARQMEEKERQRRRDEREREEKKAWDEAVANARKEHNVRGRGAPARCGNSEGSDETNRHPTGRIKRPTQPPVTDSHTAGGTTTDNRYQSGTSWHHEGQGSSRMGGRQSNYPHPDLGSQPTQPCESFILQRGRKQSTWQC